MAQPAWRALASAFSSTVQETGPFSALRIAPSTGLHPQPRAIEPAGIPAAPPALWASEGLQGGCPGLSGPARNSWGSAGRLRHFEWRHFR